MSEKLDLVTLTNLFQLRQEVSDNPELQKAYVRAAMRLMGVQDSQHRMRIFAYYGVVGSFLTFSMVTFVVALLATLRVVEVDPERLDLLWKTFVGELAGLGIWLVRLVFGKQE